MKTDKVTKGASITLVAMALVLFNMSPAVAVPPSNDDFDGANLVVEPLPFGDAVNTTEATTAGDDPDCVGNGPTVWYAYTPTQDTRIESKTFGSDYDTTLSVYTGSRGNLTQIACNDDAGSVQSRVVFDAVAGQTYFFMIGAYASGPGGNLEFTVQVAPPPFTFDLSLNPSGSVVPKTGVATIRGTVTCSRPGSASVYGQVSQKIGRILVLGSFGTFVAVCDGLTPWTATVSNFNGLFVGGPLSVVANCDAYVQDGSEYAFDMASGVVRLRGK